MPAPLLVITDGTWSLKKAFEAWPTMRVQISAIIRSARHDAQGRNLDDACSVHARPELHWDHHRISFAADGLAARVASVARSLEEVGLDLRTFYVFPKAMWKSLRTTNALENLNREFRRRTKTQASFSTKASAHTVLFAWVAVGLIVFRKVDGHQELIHCQLAGASMVRMRPRLVSRSCRVRSSAIARGIWAAGVSRVGSSLFHCLARETMQCLRSACRPST